MVNSRQSIWSHFYFADIKDVYKEQPVAEGQTYRIFAFCNVCVVYENIISYICMYTH